MKLLPVYVTLLLALFLFQGSQVTLANTCYKTIYNVGAACTDKECDNVCKLTFGKTYNGICVRGGNTCSCFYPC
ncbi:hypothetical protein ACS0TY_035267 [Phlomoides rotata]